MSLDKNSGIQVASNSSSFSWNFPSGQEPTVGSTILLGVGSWIGTTWKEIQVSARQLGLQLHSLEVRSLGDLDKAFEEATRTRAGALFLMPDPLIGSNLERIADLAAKSRLPSVYQWSEFADAGGLVAYGPDRADLYRRAATYVDKILKGAKPGGLPIEQPTKFELVVNMKAAKALGLTFSQPFLMRADRVIE
jgi:ABC-type uncharacterized transport system substrate-binding protein